MGRVTAQPINFPCLEPALEAALNARHGASQPTRPAMADPIHRSLERFLGPRIEGQFGVDRLRPLSGGGTNQLYSFDLVRSGRAEGLVLRIKTLHSGIVTAVDREFEFMKAVADSLPVPRPHWVTNEPMWFGAAALICDYADGLQQLPGSPHRMSGMGTTYGKYREGIAADFVRHLAHLHVLSIDPADVPSFEMPSAGTTDALDRRLTFWDRVWDEDRFEPHPTMQLTREWLWAYRPPVDVVSPLHGDYRNGNFLFEAANSSITAILDWELSWFGDRHSDLAYAMFRTFGAIDPSTGAFLVAGLYEREEFLARYTQISGLLVDPARLHYYSVYNLYWSTISMLGTALRSAASGATDLDVMYNVMATRAAISLRALHSLTEGAP